MRRLHKCPTCDEDHIWETTVHSRVLGAGCPYCSGRYACKCTSLAAVRPAVAAEWDRSGTNLPHTPETVLPSSQITVHWVCQQHQHTWQQVLRSRTNKDNPSPCPICRKQGLLEG